MSVQSVSPSNTPFSSVSPAARQFAQQVENRYSTHANGDLTRGDVSAFGLDESTFRSYDSSADNRVSYAELAGRLNNLDARTLNQASQQLKSNSSKAGTSTALGASSLAAGTLGALGFTIAAVVANPLFAIAAVASAALAVFGGIKLSDAGAAGNKAAQVTRDTLMSA